MVRGLRAWHIAAWLAAILAMKGFTSSSSGWFMALLVLHDVFSWAAPTWWEGAACMGVLAALLRWARPWTGLASRPVLRYNQISILISQNRIVIWKSCKRSGRLTKADLPRR